MLNKQIQQADLVLLDLGEFFEDLIGDEIGPAGPRRKGELLLVPHRVDVLIACVGVGAGGVRGV